MGAITAGGAVSIGNVLALDLTADIDTNGADLTLLSQLGISQSGGLLKVGTLKAYSMMGGISLDQANEVGALGEILADNVGDFKFRNAGDVILNGFIWASANDISLISNTGAVIQNGPGMNAATLSVSAQTGINLRRANGIGALTGLTTTTGDITFHNTGAIVAPALTTAGTLTLISDSGSVTQTGVLNAASLVVSGETGVGLHTQVNDVDTILGLTSGAGSIIYRDADGFNLAGAITSPILVSLLNGSGSIIQNAGTIATDLLTATSDDNITLNGANQVNLIGSLIAGGDINFFSTSGLMVLSEITGDDVSITSGGTFTQDNDGDITASRLAIAAATGISLTNAGNDVSTLASLINSGSGGIAFGQANGYQISGAVSATGQVVTLSSVNGAIAQLSGSGITAGTLNASASGSLTLNQGNDVGSLGVISTGDSFLFRDFNGFGLTGDLTVASQLVMLAQNGSINQTGGSITSNDINVMASVDVLLGSVNQINSISALAAGRDLLYRQIGDLSVPAINVGGALSLYSTTGSVTQTGQLIANTLNAGAVTGIDLANSTNAFYGIGNVANTTSGGISLKSQVGTSLSGAIAAAGQTVMLVSYAFTQQAASSITAGSLTGSTYTNADLGGVNDVDFFNFASNQILTCKDIDAFEIDGAVSAASVNLTSVGSITESAAGALYANNLSLIAGSAVLLGANDVASLVDADVTGNLSFRDVNGLQLTGLIAVDGTLRLESDSDLISQTGGTLDVGRLEGAGSAGFLAAQSTNAIDVLGAITSSHGTIAIATNGSLEIDGDLSVAGAGQDISIRSFDDGIAMTANGGISADDILLTAVGNVVLGDINAGGTLDVTASTGSISSIAAPIVVADVFTASAAGDIVLTGSNIDIDQLGSIGAGGNISIAGNNGDLELTQDINADTVTLGTTGALTQSAGIISSDAGMLRGATIAVDQANAIDSVSLNGTTVSYTSAGSFAANVITGGAIALTSTSGMITQTASTGRIVAHSLTASAATGLAFSGAQNDISILAGLSSASLGVTYRDMGGFDIAGNITATGQSVQLISDATGADGNDITQSGGVIMANRLNGNSAGDFTLDMANAVDSLGLLSANGNVSYRNAAGITLTDDVSAGSALSLFSNNGTILQNNGAITAGTLNASAAQGVLLIRVNDIDALGNIEAGAGTFSFRELDGFDLTGAIKADGITLQTGGAISQSGGSLITGNLTMFSNGSVSLIGANNDIDNLGGSDVQGNLSVSDIDGFTINAGIRSGSTITLVATTGDIVELIGGALDAHTLNVTTTAGHVDLFGPNTVVDLADLTAGGNIVYHGASGFTLSGDIQGGMVRLTAAAGAINQTGGSIVADNFFASAYTGLDLTSANNANATIEGLLNATSGGISYRDLGSVDLVSAVNASGQTVTFNVGGDLRQSATGIVTAARVKGSAVGSFNLGDAANRVAELGPITANSLAFTTTSGLLLTGALHANTSVSLKAVTDITQMSAGTITGDALRVQADGDIILDQANDLNSILRLHSDLGDVTYNDIDGFSLDASTFNDIWTTGTLTLAAHGVGNINQTGAGLGADTLVASAGGDIDLTRANQVASLGVWLAGGQISYSNLGDISLTDDITAGGGLNVLSTTGAITQTGGLITATSISGQSAGDFTLNNFTAALGSAGSAAGDVNISNTGDILITDLLSAGFNHAVSLTTGGSIVQAAAGRIEAGTLNLSAGTLIQLNGVSRNDVDALGDVTAGSGFTFIDDDDFALHGDIDINSGAAGAMARLQSFAGRIDQTGGAIVVDSLSVVTDTGADISGANRIGVLELTNRAGAVRFSNAQDLVLSSATSGGLVSVQTLAGQLNVTGLVLAGSIELTGADGLSASALLQSTGDITVTATTGNAVVDRIIGGDDVLVQATDGAARLTNASLHAGIDSEGDGQNLAVIASGDAKLGAAEGTSIGSEFLTRISGSGSVSVTSTGGDAGVFLASVDTSIDTLSAGGVAGTAALVLASGDVVLGTVAGYNVALTAVSGDVNANAVAVGGGDLSVYGEDFSSGVFGFTGAARDIYLTDTAGNLAMTTNMVAQRDLTIEVQSGDLIGLGGAGIVAGAGGAGDLSIEADNISIETLGASGDVALNVGVAGDVDVATLAVGDDYTLTGGTFSSGALNPIGATAGTWTLNDGGEFDFTGQMLTYNGDVKIRAADDITGGSVQSIFGSVLIEGLGDIDIEGLYAATDVTVVSANNLVLDSATASSGSVNLTGVSVTVAGLVEAFDDVVVTAQSGSGNIGAAAAGRNITVTATDGNARLGQATLNGATGGLTIVATNGDAVLGAADVLSISSDNYLERAAGNSGTIAVTGVGGAARVYLNHSAAIDMIDGADASVTVTNGDVSIGTIRALAGDINIETLDGSLTVGDATADLIGLFSTGGDLTLTGAIDGATGIAVQTDGFLDGRLASINSGGDLESIGGSVALNAISAAGDIVVTATDGDAYVEFADADSGSTVQVVSLTGSATLRGAKATDGIAVLALNTATFGADDKASITTANYGDASGGCGCVGGISVISFDGDAVVNLNRVSGAFDTVGGTGDVNVVLETGALKIADMAGFNINIEAEAGSLEIGNVSLSGGNYSLRAQDFLGSALTPTLTAGTMNDYTIVDTLDGLDTGPLSVVAQGDILVDVQGFGVLSGSARLTSMAGDITVRARGIRVDTIDAAADVFLTANAGVVDVLTGVTVGGDYTLIGQDFSSFALTPLGARAGTLSITDTLGGLDVSDPVTYGGDIHITAVDALGFGGVTSSNGDILLHGRAVAGTSLSAASGRVAASAGDGDVSVGAITAGSAISLRASGGSVSLASAVLHGVGANTLTLESANGGDVHLGADSASAIDASHVFTSAGSATAVNLTATGGSVFVNLNASDALSAVRAGQDVGVIVRTGNLVIGSIDAMTGRVDIEGPVGGLIIDHLSAHTDAGIVSGGDVALTDANVGRDLSISATGALDLTGLIAAAGETSLTAGGGIMQAAVASLSTTGLTVSAGDDVNLLGANRIEVIRRADVVGGDFAYRSVRVGGVDLDGGINVAGHTVDLRAENGGISQSGGAILAATLTGASDEGVSLGGENLIDQLGDFTTVSGAFFLNVDQALTIVGMVDSTVSLRIQSDAMTIASTGTAQSAGSGNAVILASDGVFTNNSGDDAAQAASGRWLIYSQASGDPLGSTSGNSFGSLNGSSYYGSAYDFEGGTFSAAPNAGNRFVYAYRPTLTVTPLDQRIVYNGQVPTLSALIAGLINGDAAANAWSGSPTLSGAGRNAGTYSLSATLGSLVSDMNYGFAFGSGTLIIDPKALTGTVTASNRTYDGSANATGSIDLDGVIAGDAVGVTTNGFQFADRNAGLGKTVTATGAALSGADAANYTMGPISTGAADILRRNLTGVVIANTKIYDGTTAATGSIEVTGIVAGDAVSAGGTYSFADRNAGVARTVYVSGLTLAGADAGNYDLGPVSGVADILRRSLTGVVTANNKIYDGTTTATGAIELTGVVAGDDIRVGGTLAFDNRNAAIGRGVSAVSADLTGADSSNYTLTGVANGIANIFQRTLSVTADDQSKRFGQADPSLTYVVGVGGLVQGDALAGGLARALGEASGAYVIGQGDLTASANYILSFTQGEFVIRVPAAGAVQSLQMLRTLGATSPFALDRDPSPGLIVEDDKEQDPDEQTGILSVPN